MATNHEQAVLAAAKAWWKNMMWLNQRRERMARAKLWRAVADWQQAEQARKDRP